MKQNNTCLRIMYLVLILLTCFTDRSFGLHYETHGGIIDAPDKVSGILLMNVPGIDREFDELDGGVIEQYIYSISFDQKRATTTKVPLDAKLVDNVGNMAVMIEPVRYNDLGWSGPLTRWRTFSVKLLSIDEQTNRALVKGSEDEIVVMPPRFELKEIPLDWVNVALLNVKGEDVYVAALLYLGIVANADGSLAYQLQRSGYIYDEINNSYEHINETIGELIPINETLVYTNHYAELIGYYAEVSPNGKIAYTSSADEIVVIDGANTLRLSDVCDDVVIRFCWAGNDDIFYFIWNGTSYELKCWDLSLGVTHYVKCIDVSLYPVTMDYNTTYDELAVYLSGESVDQPSCLLIALIEDEELFYYEPWPNESKIPAENISYYGQDENGTFIYEPDYLMEPRLVWLMP